MFGTRTVTTIAVMAASLLFGDLAGAQMFGSRQTGRPLARRPQPGMNNQEQEDVGTLRGTERFIRENRRPADFVGPDIRELDRFIGLLQATIQAQTNSAVEDIRRRVDRSETINQPVEQTSDEGMYSPKIDVNLSTELNPVEPPAAVANALKTLARSPQLSGASRIAVSVEGRTATLQGEVPSSTDRELAELLLSFEPGISSIENRLQVNAQLQPGEDSIQALRDRTEPREAWTTLSNGSTQATNSQRWDSVTGGEGRSN